MQTENLKYSVKNLLARKSRSFLTILSIFIGIATIFLFISFGFGLYDYVDKLATQSGVDKFLVQARSAGAPGTDSAFKLEDKDLEEIRRSAGVSEASGMYIKVIQVEHNKERRYTFMMGFSPTPQDIRLVEELTTVDIVKGRQLKKGDSGKAVLGYNYQFPKKIFTKAISVGDKVLINGAKFDVVGFYGEIGSPQDDSQVYLTEDDVKTLFPSDHPYGIIIGRVNDVDRIDSTVEIVKKNLRKLRDQKKGEEDFFVQTYEELINQFMTILNIIIGFVIMIALVSVLVSAINTANTMVTSVLERTKEIGIMKAIGAKNSTIRNIFLLESSLLGLVAGILGVIFGAILANFAGAVLSGLGWSFLSPRYTWYMFAALIVFATIVGTLSGVTVAIQAAKQNPVDSLRYE